ncbi:hypothetical protein HJC23_007848 [Cyclotella cryptica]|uniref:Uncharacterized protein n=1 Tax=Cyclotella cryptica TaxID=29204 RepID=A0ABD3R000_9STRA|eukprot:CCRYP_000175-RA/>CCRYP_000175-RA protein AED:0.00 eAED:0.00 QI:72/-1/1/1/-1/1/1/334/489
MPSCLILGLLMAILMNPTNGFSNNIERHRQQHRSDSPSWLATYASTPGIKNMSNSSTQRSSPSNPSLLFSESSKYHRRNNGLSRRRRWLVVDFDGTCTQHDTTPLLPKLASFATRSRSSLSSSGDRPKSSMVTDREAVLHEEEEYDHKQDLERRLSQFQQLENEFLKRYDHAKASLVTNDEQSDVFQMEEERLQAIHAALDALDEPSTIVTRMVSESRVLHGLGHADSNELEGMLNIHGVTTQQLENESDDRIEIHLRPGCETTLARILLSHSQSHHDKEIIDAASDGNYPDCLGWSLAVLSINWCPALIEASLVQPVLRKKRSILNQIYCDTEVPIWSNHVDGEGVVTLHVPGALAKRERIMELRRCLEHDFDDTNENLVLSMTRTKHLIVYVGDSSTDLAALLEADIGIIMGNSSSTRTIAEKWGIEILALQDRRELGFDLDVNNIKTGDGKRKLWQVDNWHEINLMLEELDEYWKSNSLSTPTSNE